MIEIKVIKNRDTICGFECEGHSGYAERGSDIVCSSVSTLMGVCIVGVSKVLDCTFEHIQNDKKAYFKLIVKKNVGDEKVQSLLITVFLSLQALQKDYKKYITLNLIGG